jgi:uncharacterized protein YerC
MGNIHGVKKYLAEKLGVDRMTISRVSRVIKKGNTTFSQSLQYFFATSITSTISCV